MKRFLLAMLMVAFLFTGCVGVQGTGPVDADNILKTTDAIYRDIRIVVTDPEVKPMFSPEELEKMAKLEAQYLDVVETLQMYPNDADAIQQISWLATEVLGVFEQVAYVEKTRPYIAAIRISIQILKNHL